MYTIDNAYGGGGILELSVGEDDVKNEEKNFEFLYDFYCNFLNNINNT